MERWPGERLTGVIGSVCDSELVDHMPLSDARQHAVGPPSEDPVRSSALWSSCAPAVVILLFASLPVCSADSRELETPAKAILTIDMKGAEDCPPSMIEEMQEEAEEVFAPAGVQLQWRYLDLSRIRESVATLVVATFTGTCQCDGLGVPAIGQGPLGWTSVTDGTILPFCNVHYDRVREVLLRSMRHLPRGQQERLLGRALGRVLAHELYHILANTRGHAKTGLAKPLLSDGDLAQEELHFSARELELIHDAMYRPASAQLSRKPSTGGQIRILDTKPANAEYQKSIAAPGSN